MSKRPKSVPAFASEAEARAYWESHDSSPHVDWSTAERVRLPNLKPSTKAISRRRIEANKRDVPYQSLIKVWLFEKLEAT